MGGPLELELNLTRTEGPLNLPQVFLQNLPSLIPFFKIFLHSFTNIKKNISQKTLGPPKIFGPKKYEASKYIRFQKILGFQK